MKRNMQKTMDRLKIDEGMQNIVRQLWKHNYVTNYSCGGHGDESKKYLTVNVNSGDGWLEQHAHEYGLQKDVLKDNCPEKQFHTDSKTSWVVCPGCVGGLNGHEGYSGKSNQKVI